MMKQRERGSASLENTITYPAILILIFVIFQAAITYHGQNVAHGAATVAYHSARTLEGSAHGGEVAGRASLEASSVVRDGAVSVTRTATEVTVTVTGRTAYIIPGVPSSIHETVSGPTERFVQP